MATQVEINDPKPYQIVGATFTVSGWIPKDWFHPRTNIGLGYCLIDLDCCEFSCSSVHVPLRFRDIFRKRAWVHFNVSFNSSNVPFVEKAKGRVVIGLDGKDGQRFYIPVIVKGFETVPADRDIIDAHATVGKRLEQIKLDLENYYSELEAIGKSRQLKDRSSSEYRYAGLDIGSRILKIIEDSDDSFEDYLYIEEDKRETELEEKYKDALAWRGPLLRGLVAKMGAFEMRVYSDDHDKHFHVIHKGKGINARFSFPDMKLISYAGSASTIGAKTEKKIRELCLDTEILKKFEREFAKRG